MIKKISIDNFKSIKNAKFVFGNKQDIVCLIGKNGSGKSNIFKAIKYFFDNISRPYSEESIIDNSNPYTQKCTISILFDLKLLRDKSKHNPDLKSKFNVIDEYLNKHICKPDDWESLNKKELELTMTQYKDGTIMWNVDNKGIRETVKSLFPIYYLDTRRLDIFTWEQLWKIISDLSAAMPQKSQEDCRDIIDTTFTEIYGEKYKSSKDRIEKAFKTNNISLDPYHFDSKYKSAFAMRFGGEQFLVDGQPLTYFSDGTNSYNYLILLSTLIPQISEISCKYPIVLLDEPETGLHSEYISKFVDTIFNNVRNNSLMFFSTHSPKLISDLSNNQVNFQLYKINRIGLHSEIRKMNTSWLVDSKHKITVKETECYFYDCLVYLEGETEVELFSNKRLKNLFKNLDKIHFYSFDSNNERLNIVNSKNINLGTKYKIIIDVDKVITYNFQTNKFKPCHGINPICDKESTKTNKFRYFNDNSTNLSAIYNNIIILLKNTYKYKNNCHYIDEQKFNNLMQHIKMYCNCYNIIVNWSTIEGELITYENTDKFLDFLLTQTISQKVINQHNDIVALNDKREKSVLLSCEYQGKTEIGEGTPKHPVKFKNKNIKAIETDKTSGWVSKWLNYYFDTYIDILSSETEKKTQFKQDFPSLYDTLQEIESMVE